MTTMPPRRNQTSRTPPPPPEKTVLKIPLERAQTQLQERITAGRELADTRLPDIEGDPATGRLIYGSRLRTTRPTYPELDDLRHRVSQWTDYNQTWLNNNLGGEAAEEYKSASNQWLPVADDPMSRLRFLREDIAREISKLESIRDRLTLWPCEDDEIAPNGASAAPADAPFFIVHGSDTLRAEGVARVLERATGRDTVILREQANLGRTLIEKFEDHAEQASYAIILLTPDDEGGRMSTPDERRPRARQNVIFEMGYFYGILGRHKVSVLLHPGVEKPSDTDGIAYISFDDAGAWKTELFRELENAKIHINTAKAG